MNSKTIVHFGAGALGRGMVVPLLFESGYDVVVLDTNEELNKELNRTRSYTLKLSDAEPGKQDREIRIVEAVSPVTEKEKVERYLRQANVVTTSVRRDNLIHVARTLANTWGTWDGDDRLIICCENIEHVGTLFKKSLEEVSITDEQRTRLDKIAVPDTIVDRICASNWPESSVVTGELFHECAVDAKVVARTGIEFIPAVGRIDQDFSRKRLLLNTYADAISFLAKGAGKTYLYEAAQSDDINRAVEPYMALLQRMLVLEYGCDPDQLHEWRIKYQKRLSNSAIPRRLDTVARNFWMKLALDERFVWPLIRLLEHGVDIRNGEQFFANLIRVGSSMESVELNSEELKATIKKLWGETPAGTRLYRHVVNYL
jgi:mannitol-1-phosphate 5-dehydrogenase